MSGNNTLTGAILGALILKPDILENSDVNADDFPAGRLRDVFGLISEHWETTRPAEIDLVILAEKLTGDSPAAFVSSLIDGRTKTDSETFKRRVHELRRQRIQRRVLADLKRAIQSEQQTGEIDAEEMQRVRSSWQVLDDLDKPVPASCSPLCEIQPKTISWLWPGRLPLGMLTLLAGDPGRGKSFLSLWIASRLSRGDKFPDTLAPPVTGGTIYLSAEDSAAHALRPRADANLGDASRIYVMEEPSLDISEDLKRIRGQIDADPAIKLLVIDPLNSFLGQVDYFKDTSVRAVLAPLCRFLEEREIAGLGVVHLNKKIDLGGIYRIGGSIAFAGVARSILAVTQHPEDEDRRLLRPLKMNYAKRPAALSFRIDDDLRLSFDLDPVPIDHDEALSHKAPENGADNSFAAEWLRERLADGGEELKALMMAAADVGISRRTLFYVKKKIGIITHASGYRKDRTSVWELPR